MNRTISIIFALCLAVRIYAGPTPQEKYIEKYARTAVSEMFRSGVPASITLAQGMLESANGKSRLATEGNNHFGIKCHEWKGARMFHDDDRKGECFRKYRNPEESFRDHSDFLRYRDRYKFLFELETSDYKGWAYGLKKAGYATDPAYPGKLIALIERYDLTRFDREDVSEKTNRDHRNAKKERRRHRKDSVGKGSGTSGDAASAVDTEVVPGSRIPVSPSRLEEPVPLDGMQSHEFRFSLSRQMYSHNKVAFVYSVEGESYQSIARLYDLFLKEILLFNDAGEDAPLMPGTVVYLQPKRKYAASHIDKYIAEGGESLRDISQRFAVKLGSLMKLNGLERNHTLKEGDTVLLRRKGR